jgi:glycosyltransferase involved in cell wall biosynthesis
VTDERQAGARVSCVLPARNEVESIARTVAEWAGALPTLTREHEIIVVDDGSTDGTTPLLAGLATRYAGLRVITHRENVGYGAAITSGFLQARYPLLFFTDADGQYDPDDLRPFLERVRTADVVVGYRVRRADPAVRRLLSAGYNALVRRITGVALRDVNCAFKLMHRDTFERLDVEATHFVFNAELALSAQHAGMTIAELPVRHRPRHAGRTSVRALHVVTSLYGLAEVRARRRRVASLGYRRSGTS